MGAALLQGTLGHHGGSLQVEFGATAYQSLKTLGLEEETLASPSNPISQVLW